MYISPNSLTLIFLQYCLFILFGDQERYLARLLIAVSLLISVLYTLINKLSIACIY